MTLLVHATNPEEVVEAAFFRIQQTCMADVPILNLALQVQAIDFQRWHGHWLGMVVTPWCMSMTLVPGMAEDWESVGVNKRRFIHFPAGDFAFLGGQEVELGEYQSCSLFSPMDRFANQLEAVQTARAAMIGLLTAPVEETGVSPAKAAVTAAPTKSMSRRGFFALGKS
jgi:[NiFe] hydrogenase assembly HybE family chaperone